MRNTRRKAITLDERARYEVVFAGRVEPYSLNWGVTAQITPSRDESCEVTVITGVFDQAALHGLLRSGYSHGFPLISVRQVKSGSDQSATLDATGYEET